MKGDGTICVIFCNIEKESCENIGSEETMKLNGTPIAETGLFINNDGDEGLSIGILTHVFNEAALNYDVKIHYCPFCGRKLD